MKNLGVLLVLAAIGAAVWYFFLYQPPCVKAYLAYRDEVAEIPPNREYYLLPGTQTLKRKIKIEEKTVEEDRAHLWARETAVVIPANSSAANQRKAYVDLEAELELQDGEWVVVSEESLNEELPEEMLNLQ